MGERLSRWIPADYINREENLQRGKASLFSYLNELLGLFPTSILLAAHDKVNFNPFKGEGNAGILEIPKGSKLYVIDGMHRVEALRAIFRENKNFGDYWLNLAIIPLQEKGKFWELLIFHIVNSRARKVETDLAYRQMQTLLTSPGVPKWVREKMMTKGEERGGRAAQIVDLLMEDVNSPFFGKIKYYGEEKETYHLIENSVLIRYISVLFKEKAFRGLDEYVLAELLENYWSAIAELYTIAFNDPKNYNLLGSHFGVAVLTYLFPTIWSYCVKEGKVDKENMKKYLALLKTDLSKEDAGLEPDIKKQIGDKWWSKAYGAGIVHASGERAFRYVTEQMERKIAIALRRKRESEKAGN